MIYLDNSATTQIDTRVTEAMLPYLKKEYGNPSSRFYALANNASEAVEKARTNLASLINCNSTEIVFTSGASESNNLVIKGIADRYEKDGKHIITSKIEHKSILETCRYLKKKGFEITYLPVNSQGQIENKVLKENIKKNTILVSIIWGNNEIGTLNNINILAKTCKERDVFFHTDATQVLGKVNLDASKVPFDFLSCSAHKIYGPKGIGALFIREDEMGFKPDITPLIHGGDQEDGLRAGTLPVHNIVGFGKASEIAFKEMYDYCSTITNLEKYFKEKIKKRLPFIRFNGSISNNIPGIINLTIPAVSNEVLLMGLKSKVAISTGSACSIGQPSHVLKALGMPSKEISNTIRISIGKFNTKEDIELFIDILVKEIKRLKSLS